MDILIDARINTKCEHNVCALEILWVLIAKQCHKNREEDDDMQTELLITEREHIISITFIN